MSSLLYRVSAHAFVKVLLRVWQSVCHDILSLIRCGSMPCHDTVMLTQVRVDEVLANNSTLFLGVTRIPPERLDVTKYSADLKNSVVIAPYQVYYRGTSVSYHGYKCVNDFMVWCKCNRWIILYLLDFSLEIISVL